MTPATNWSSPGRTVIAPARYIGARGSRRTHEDRMRRLIETAPRPIHR